MEQKKDFLKYQDTTQKLLFGLEKTEIHLHLEGLATVETIWTLINKNNLNYKNVESKEDLKKRFSIKTLEEFLDLFINIIQNSFQTEKDLEYLLNDAEKYLINNNIVYAEIFFAPSKFLSLGFDFKTMIDILTAGAEKIKNQSGKEIKFIIDVSRTFGVENAENNLELAIKHRTPAIIGIGLGGSEIKGPAKDFAKVFEKAIENNFHVVAHAGEDLGPESIWDTINYLKVERIGHGISAIQDKKLMNLLVEKQIPMEICPTSNLFTRKFVKTLETHPVKQFFQKKLNVTINTDDPTLFSTSLIEEYAMLLKRKIFTQEEIVELVKNNIYATFLSKTKKDALWKRNLAILKNFDEQQQE